VKVKIGAHAFDFGLGSRNGTLPTPDGCMHCDYHGIQTALQEELELRCGGADINNIKLINSYSRRCLVTLRTLVPFN